MFKLPSLSTLVPNVATGLILSVTGIISWKLISFLQWIAYKILPSLVEQAVVLAGAVAVFYYAAVAFQFLNDIAGRSVGSFLPEKATQPAAATEKPAEPTE
jgi:hypothetical protein